MGPDPHNFLSDANVRDFLRRKARQFARAANDPAVTADDVEQDLIVEILRRLPAYDPGRGTPVGFAFLVAPHAIADLVRRRATQMRRTRPRSLDGCSAGNLIRDRRLRDVTERDLDLEIDLPDVLEALPSELREVTGLLKSDSVAEAARRLGCSRKAIYDRLGRIKKRFVDAGLATDVEKSR